MPSRRSLAAVALLASACGPSSQTSELRSAIAATGARSAVQGVALRFAGRRGADVELYQLPGLDEVAWRFQTPGLVTARLVGFAADDDRIYTLTPTNQLTALDLATGRARTADSLVRWAALGPDGTVLFARRDGALASLTGRRAIPLGRVEGREIEAVFGGPGSRLIAVLSGNEGRTIAVSAAPGLGEGRPLPDGPLAVAPWGDAAAVITDTGLVVVDLLGEEPDAFLRIRHGGVAVAFSSSGHRLYVATDQPAVVVVDRFALRRLATIALPTAVTELRADPFGEWLLASGIDSVVALPQSGGAARVVAGEWAADLPAAGPDGTLLVRRGDDVVALDPQTLDPRGRVRDGADDRWLVIQWDPRRPALQVSAPVEAGGPRPAGQEIYVQVSSTSNPQWAEDEAQGLRVAGLRATVLPPAVPGEPYRVVIGPYRTRDEAEDVGRKLGKPYWIFTRGAGVAEP